MKVEITFIEETLGTTPGDENVFREFIAKKSPNALSIEEEVEALGIDSVVEKGKTVFPKENGKPFAWDYQIKGMFKDSCGMLRLIPGTESSKLKAYKKIIDGLIFVKPRKIFYIIPEGKTISECQRPLRGQTMRGERVSLAISETLPPGTKLQFEIEILDKGLEKVIREWLNYGKLRGFSQWRNSGKGRFEWKEL